MIVEDHERGNVRQGSSHLWKRLFKYLQLLFVLVGDGFVVFIPFWVERSNPILYFGDKFRQLRFFFRSSGAVDESFESGLRVVFLLL